MRWTGRRAGEARGKREKGRGKREEESVVVVRKCSIIIEHHPTVVGAGSTGTSFSTTFLLVHLGARLGRGPPISGNATTTVTTRSSRSCVVPPTPYPTAAQGRQDLPKGTQSTIAEPGYSGAKRICSFQLRPYLVVMHAGEHSPA